MNKLAAQEVNSWLTMISASTYNVMYNSNKRWVKYDTTQQYIQNTESDVVVTGEIILLVAYSNMSKIPAGKGPAFLVNTAKKARPFTGWWPKT